MVGNKPDQSRRQSQKMKVSTAVPHHFVSTSVSSRHSNTHVTVANVAWLAFCKISDSLSELLSPELLGHHGIGCHLRYRCEPSQ